MTLPSARERWRRLWYLPLAAFSLALPLIFGTRNIDGSEWRLVAPVLLGGLAVWAVARIPGRRRLAATAMAQLRGSWAALIWARPRDLEQFGSMSGDPVVRSFANRHNFHGQELEIVIGFDTDGRLIARTLGGSYLPSLSFELVGVDELRLQLDENDSPLALGLSAGDESVGYRIRKPRPRTVPASAVDERTS